MSLLLNRQLYEGTENEIDAAIDNVHDLIGSIYDATQAGGGGMAIVEAGKVYTPPGVLSTNSNTFVDVDGTNVAQEIAANGNGKAYTRFGFLARKETNQHGYFRITDGTNHSPEIRLRAAGGDMEVNLEWVFDTVAGNVTYKLQYRSNDGNEITIRPNLDIQITVIEWS